MRVLRWVLAIAVGFALLGCESNGPTSTYEELGEDANTLSFGRRFPSDTTEGLFTFGPGDELVLRVPDDPSLDGAFIVRPDGFITVPLLDEVQVAGLTPPQARAKLEAAAAKYIRDPRVTVSAGAIASKYYFVVGHDDLAGGYKVQKVAHPGDVTLLDAFVEMGSPSGALSDETAIRVIRADPRKRIKHTINLREIFLEGRSGGNIQIRPDDIIVVPTTWLGKVSNVITGITSPFKSLFTFTRAVVEIDYGVRTIQGDTSNRRGSAF